MTLDNFLYDSQKIFNSKLKRKEGKVFEALGEINCLLYIKERKSRNQNWGITKNVIDRLTKQSKPWFVLLLSYPPSPNYLLTSDNIYDYIKNKWIPNKDGDYKTSPTFPDENEFLSLQQLKNKIEKIIHKDGDEAKEDQLEDSISLTEGGKKVIISIQAERNPILRKQAIKFHGLICKVCHFDFEKKYGKWGEGFIEVHHIHPLGQSKHIKIQTDPQTDMIVLCANCHRMIHRKRGVTLTIEELKSKMIIDP